MLAYEADIGQSDLSTSSVQTAIQGLRERGLIWQSSRGQYALEDESFGEWFKYSQINQQDN